jgi:hypothetical protein
MSTKKALFGLFGLLLYCNASTAQSSIKDSTIFLSMAGFSYAGQMPMGELADRFGLNSNIGLHATFKTKKNFIWAIDWGFMFSTNVKETEILAGLETSNGYIIDQSGEFGQYILSERGFSINASFGKVFPIIGPNPNSGIVAKFGVGLLKHKIRIDNREGRIPILTEDYIKGYDRLTWGLAVTQFIGYMHLSNKRLVNYFFGIEATQGFTQGRRDYQYDLMAPYLDNHVDLLLGLRAGWNIPIYRRAPKEFYTD